MGENVPAGRPSMTLLSLPDDVLAMMAHHLPLTDLTSLRATCTSLRDLIAERLVDYYPVPCPTSAASDPSPSPSPSPALAYLLPRAHAQHRWRWLTWYLPFPPLASFLALSTPTSTNPTPSTDPFFELLFALSHENALSYWDVVACVHILCDRGDHDHHLRSSSASPTTSTTTTIHTSTGDTSTAMSPTTTTTTTATTATGPTTGPGEFSFPLRP